MGRPRGIEAIVGPGGAVALGVTLASSRFGKVARMRALSAPT